MALQFYSLCVLDLKNNKTLEQSCFSDTFHIYILEELQISLV